jgi:2-polyprenyl-6-methoxyphenol hydroxylase-like FAD-dependent oxidoreductase
LALLPLDRPVAAQSFGLVWSMPAAEAAQHLASDDASFEVALNAAVQHAAAGSGPGPLRLASARAAWPLVRANAQPWTGEGWALLGDAAHAMHPLAGQGLNTGLADVACLARVLGQSRQTQPWRSLGDARLLRRYARERAAPAAAMSQLVDGLWQVFAQDALTDRLPLQAVRNGGLHLINQAGPLKRWLAGRALDAS